MVGLSFVKNMLIKSWSVGSSVNKVDTLTFASRKDHNKVSALEPTTLQSSKSNILVEENMSDIRYEMTLWGKLRVN